MAVTPAINSSDEREVDLRRRRLAACELLADLGADALVTDRPEHVLYLTGYRSRTWQTQVRPIIAILRVDGGVEFVGPPHETGPIVRDVSEAKAHVYGGPGPVPPEMSLPDGALQYMPYAAGVLQSVLQKAGVRCVAVDGLDAIFPPITRLGAVLTQFACVDASPLIWSLRRHKSRWEAERMRAAASYLDDAFAALVPQLRVGMTEIEIDRLLRIELLRTDADDIANAYAVVLADGREILGVPTERRWQAGEILYIDSGTTVDGYISDYNRMYVAGEASPRQRAAYARVVAARDAAIEAFRPGMAAADLAAVVIRSLDVDPDSTVGRFGHGLGFNIEPPSLNPDDPTPLDPGTVFCLEPGIADADSYYALEEAYFVTDAGLDRLTPEAPRDLIEL